MAPQLITIHDSAGDEIPQGTPFVLPTATPGTPTAETEFSVRNNDVAGPAVDTAFDVKLTLAGRLAGALTDPDADGLAFLVQRALQVKVSAVSGGAMALLTEFRPLGTAVTLDLGDIPDGGVVTIPIRTVSPLLASLSDVELFVVVESIQSTPLEDGAFELHSNFVYDGLTGGIPALDFTSVFSFIGSLDPGATDDTVDIWSNIVLTRAGSEETFTPVPATETFDALDGAAAALVAGEAYYATLSLNGTDSFTITKGLKAVAPLSDSDKAAAPDGEVTAGFVVVPFGLAIDTTEDVLPLGFFGLIELGGLDVSIAGGQAAVGGRYVNSGSATTITLVDDQVTFIYRQPETGFEAVEATVSPTDLRSMKLFEVTTAAGAITLVEDRRRIGQGALGGIFQAATFIIDVAAGNLQVVHVTIRDGLGEPILSNLEIGYFISGDPAGVGISPNALTDLTVGSSPQSVRFLVDNLTGVFGTDLTGVVDATFDESSGPSGQTFHLVIQVGARKFVSGPIIPKP